MGPEQVQAEIRRISLRVRSTLLEAAHRAPTHPDHDVILAFVSGTTFRDLVRELGRNRPQTIDELMDVVANYAAGEEAVGAFFNNECGKGKAPVDENEGPSRGSKKGKKKKKT